MLKRNFAVLIAVLAVLMVFCGCVSTKTAGIEFGEYSSENLFINPLSSVFFRI